MPIALAGRRRQSVFERRDVVLVVVPSLRRRRHSSVRPARGSAPPDLRDRSAPKIRWRSRGPSMNSSKRSVTDGSVSLRRASGEISAGYAVMNTGSISRSSTRASKISACSSPERPARIRCLDSSRPALARSASRDREPSPRRDPVMPHDRLDHRQSLESACRSRCGVPGS